jgi:hypothetical protein
MISKNHQLLGESNLALAGEPRDGIPRRSGIEQRHVALASPVTDQQLGYFRAATVNQPTTRTMTPV